MANLYKKTMKRLNPKTGKTVKTKSKKWWGRYRDAIGRERRVPLSTDKMAAQTMLNELLRKVEREKSGLPTQLTKSVSGHFASTWPTLANTFRTRKLHQSR